MKKSIFTIAIAALIAGTMINGCQSATEKTENSTEQMQKSMNDDKGLMTEPGMMMQDSITEYQKFKKEAREKINELEKSMAEVKAKIASGKEQTKAEYEKKLALLEQKNNELKNKLEEYQEEGQDNWEIFKAEFSRDMDELGKALKDFTIKN